MDNTHVVTAALEALEQDSPDELFALMIDEVSWDWSNLSNGLSPVVGKDEIGQAFMHGFAWLPAGYRFSISGVDEGGLEDTICAELVGHICRPGETPVMSYYTWVFDMADGQVTAVRAYMEDSD